MGYISSRKLRLQTQLASVQSQISSMTSMLTEQSGKENLSYSFDSGEGSQRTTRRSLKEIQDSLDRLYAMEAHLINELSRMGIVSVKLRRKSYHNAWY